MDKTHDQKRYYNSFGNQQEYQILDKQNLKKLESQEYSNRTLARLICVSELYALSLGYNNPQMYKKFDQFDNLRRKNKDELEGELILQIKCCKISMDSYIKKYNKYDFPLDFNKKKTLEELEYIKKLVCNKNKKYYKAIIKLVNGDTNINNFDENLYDLENDDDKENDNGLKNPEQQLKIDIPIMKYVDSIKNKVKNNYEKNPKYKVKLELNKPMEKNVYLENALKYQDELEKKKKNKKMERFSQNNQINSRYVYSHINSLYVPAQKKTPYEDMDISDYR
jgi:hypothetical protein